MGEIYVQWPGRQHLLSRRGSGNLRTRFLQWHLIGCPFTSNCQNGGGDTEITIARNNDVFASDLQTLTCNSAFRSYDQGATWLPSAVMFSLNRPSVDGGSIRMRVRPAGVFIFQPMVRHRAVTFRVDGHQVTATGTDLVNNPTAVVDPNNGEGCIGRFIINPVNGHIYVPGDSKTWFSTDGRSHFRGSSASRRRAREFLRQRCHRYGGKSLAGMDHWV